MTAGKRLQTRGAYSVRYKDALIAHGRPPLKFNFDFNMYNK